MKTEDLVTRLSQDEPQPSRWTPATALMIAVMAAFAAALALSFVWLTPRIDLLAVLNARDHTVLLKFFFTFSVVVGALPIVRDLTTPGRSVGTTAIVALLPFFIVALLAVRELAMLPAAELHRVTVDASWVKCLWQVPVLGLPAFAILAFCARRLAPTNLVRAGAYIGLLAGGIGAAGYALHCHDDSMLFVAIAYTLAIAEMAAVGAMLGPRVLRWT